MKPLGILLVLLFSFSTNAKEIKLPKTTYTPVFKDPGEADIMVGPLRVDETPVTNQEYRAFVLKHPEYGRSKISKIFADPTYLSHWRDETSFSPSVAKFPVTHVSWFAARRYCASHGKRLPTIAEWEVASDAQNPLMEEFILKWYANPKARLQNVGLGPKNKWGVKDAHGMIWEWVDNFSESIMSGDSRGGGSTETLFCGAAALKANDPTRYAAFMRFAFRNSLTGKYVSANLGFRCVKD